MPQDPPVKDINHNCSLDSQELLNQLILEDALPAKDQKLHHVLQFLGADKFVKAYNQAILELSLQNKLNGTESAQAAITFNALFEKNIEDIHDMIRLYPNGKAGLLEKEKELLLQSGLSSDEVSDQLADAATTFDFAESFDVAFPKGFHLEAKDMNEFMHHFGQLVVPLTPATPDSSRQK